MIEPCAIFQIRLGCGSRCSCLTPAQPDSQILWCTFLQIMSSYGITHHARRSCDPGSGVVSAFSFPLSQLSRHSLTWRRDQNKPHYFLRGGRNVCRTLEEGEESDIELMGRIEWILLLDLALTEGRLQTLEPSLQPMG